MKHKLLLITTTLAICIAAKAYTVAPACPDFKDINASYAEAFTGNTDDPFTTQGVVTGRHTLITAQGTDLNTGGALSLLPAGESSVVRLGNQNVGAEAEALSYHFMVDKNNPVLLVKFAVVFEDPGHTGIHQPRFVIRITDKNGDLIEDCAEYDVSAREDIPGFQSYQGSYYMPVRWRDWTNVGLDMSRFIGQEIQVQFITYDCTLGGHFGYAYFTASCISNRLQLDGCTGSQFTLEAPENFESYQWSNGATTRTTTFNTATSNNSQLTCTVTSATGCQFPLYAYVTTNSGSISNGSYQDAICEGETYTKYNFDLPPQEAGKHHYENIIIDPATCSGNKTIELDLTVIKRYNPIKAAICHGQDYIANGFNIIKPAVGVRRDTLQTGTINSCNTYDVLELTVSANLNMPNVIQGDASPCSSQLVTYSFAGAETLTKFEWSLPANAKFYKGGKFSQQITLYYTDDTAGTLTLTGENGCGNGTANLPVHPRQTYSVQLNEEICQGNNFNKNDFNLGVQDSVGYFVYEKHLKSSLGCDSTVTLALNVLPTPVVRIEPKNLVLCNPGDEITLWALTDSMENCFDYSSLTPTAESEFNVQPIFGKPNNWVIGDLFMTPGGGYLGAGGKVVIPSKINGDTVWVISNNAFKLTKITEIVIPSTVFGIGAEAFGDCSSLTYVTFLSKNTVVSPDAFKNSPNVIIRCYPNSTVFQYAIDNNIKYELMEECTNGSGNIGTNNNSNNGNIPCGDDYGAWYNTLTPAAESDFKTQPLGGKPNNCTIYNIDLVTFLPTSAYLGSGGKVVIPSKINNDTVWVIGNNAFQSSNITEVVIPPTVTAVAGAFTDCPQLTYVTVSKNTVLGVDAFRNSPNVIIRCYENSYTHQYAIVNNIKFELIKDCTSSDNTTDIQIYDCDLDYLWSTGDTKGYTTVKPTKTTEYSVTVTTKNGCSTTAKQTVVVNTNAPQTINETICEGEVYKGYGLNAKTTGIYPVTVHEDNCDVTLNVNLTVNPAYRGKIVDQVCAGTPYRKHGLDFTLVQPGVFRDTLRYLRTTGCDSIVALEITVLPEAQKLLRDTVCQNTSYTKNGFSLPVQNVSGDFTHTLVTTSSAGCDSTVMLKLFVNPVYKNIISDELEKDGAYNKYNFNFARVTQDTTATKYLQSVGGCDSTVVLNLKAKTSCRKECEAVVKQGLIAYYPFCGNANDHSGNTNNGIVHGATLTADRFGVSDRAYHFDGIDDYIEIPNSDSLRVLTNDFTISFWVKSPTVNIPPICKSAVNGLPIHFRIYGYSNRISLIFNEKEYIFSNIFPLNVWYQVVIVFENNVCRLFIDNVEVTAQTITNRSTYTFTTNNNLYLGSDPHGVTEYHSGELDELMIYRKGLSKGEIDAIYNNISYSETTDSICAGNNYTFNGKIYSVAGTYKDTLVTAAGCDSIITLNLKMKADCGTTSPCTNVQTNLTDTICQNNPYTDNGFTLPAQTTAGTFTHQLDLQTTQGCDSTVVLALTVNPISKKTLYDTIFVNNDYVKDGFNLPVQTTIGDFVKTLTSSNLNGCDSIVTLNLKVKPVGGSTCTPKQTNLYDIICQHEGYNNNGFQLNEQSAAGNLTYQRILKTHDGCDSTVILHLTVNKSYNKAERVFIEKGKSITINGQTYTDAGMVAHSYFTVEGCDSTIIYTISLQQNTKPQPYSECDPILPDSYFTPNGDTLHDLWQVKNIDCYDYWIEIYDRYGKLLRRWDNNFTGWDGMYRGKPVIATDYWYIIHLRNTGLREFTGHFNLKR